MKRVGRRGRVLGIMGSEEELLDPIAQRKILEAAGIEGDILLDMSEEEKNGTLKAILKSNPALLEDYMQSRRGDEVHGHTSHREKDSDVEESTRSERFQSHERQIEMKSDRSQPIHGNESHKVAEEIQAELETQVPGLVEEQSAYGSGFSPEEGGVKNSAVISDSPQSVHEKDKHSDIDIEETQAPEHVAESTSDGSDTSPCQRRNQQNKENEENSPSVSRQVSLSRHRKHNVGQSLTSKDKSDQSNEETMSKELSSKEAGKQYTHLVTENELSSEDGEETQPYEVDVELLMADTQMEQDHRKRQENTPEPVPESQPTSCSPLCDASVEMREEVVCDEVHKLRHRKSSLREHFTQSTNKVTLWPFYAPVHVKDPACYTQVIRLMFEIYIRRLHRAQLRMVIKPTAWGKPVKAGPHVEKCLMARQAGSDDETNEEEEKRRSLRSGRHLGKSDSQAQKMKYQITDDSDEDFKMIPNKVAQGCKRPLSNRKSENENSIKRTSRDHQPSRLRIGQDRVIVKNILDEEDAIELFGEEEKDEDLIIKSKASESEEDWLPPKKQDKRIKIMPSNSRGRGRGKVNREKISKSKEKMQETNIYTAFWLNKKRTGPSETITSKNVLDLEGQLQRETCEQEHKLSVIDEDESSNTIIPGKTLKGKELLKVNSVNNILDSDEEEMMIIDRRPREAYNYQDKNVDENLRNQKISQEQRYIWSDSESNDNMLPWVTHNSKHRKTDTDSLMKFTAHSSVSVRNDRRGNQKEEKNELDDNVTIHNDDSSNDQKSSGSVKHDDVQKDDKDSTIEYVSGDALLSRTSSDITSSQGSETLLDAHGNLYSTQLLHTKRTVNLTKRASRPVGDKSINEHTDITKAVVESDDKHSRRGFRTRKYFTMEAARLEINSEDELMRSVQARDLNKKQTVTQGSTREKKRDIEDSKKGTKKTAHTAVSEIGTDASDVGMICERTDGRSDSASGLETEVSAGPHLRTSDKLKRKLMLTTAVDMVHGSQVQNLERDSYLKKRKMKDVTGDKPTKILREHDHEKISKMTTNVRKKDRQQWESAEQIEDPRSSSEQSVGSDETELVTKQQSDSHYLKERNEDTSSLSEGSRKAPSQDSCPICGETFLLTVLEAHASICGEEPVMERDDNEEIRCMICNKEVPPYILRDHQAKCSAQEDRSMKRQTRSLRGTESRKP